VIIAGVLFLCLLLLGSFLISSSVLAQEPIEKSGELVGGHSDSIPIQLKLGKMVVGKIIATGEPLRVTIDDPAGKEVQNYGSITHGSFSYAAKIDGEHYIVITNPNPIAVHARGYTLTHEILPTTLPPGTGSGNITLWNRIISFITPFFWLIGVVLFLFLVLSAPARVERKWVPFYVYRIFVREIIVEEIFIGRILRRR